MTPRLLPFLLSSVAFHGALLWMSGQFAPAEQGLARAGRQAHAASPLAVRIVPPARPSVEPTVEPTMEPAAPAAESVPAPAPEAVAAQDTGAAVPQPETFHPAGRLTRQPAPAENIDLNLADLGSLSFKGKLKLTLFIDASGKVTEISDSATTEEERLFAEQIALRFKNARFTPGEIHGRPVRSRLTITVVSEDLPPDPPNPS